MARRSIRSRGCSARSTRARRTLCLNTPTTLTLAVEDERGSYTLVDHDYYPDDCERVTAMIVECCLLILDSLWCLLAHAVCFALAAFVLIGATYAFGSINIRDDPPLLVFVEKLVFLAGVLWLFQTVIDFTREQCRGIPSM